MSTRHTEQENNVLHVPREAEAFDAEAAFLAKLPANVSERLLERNRQDREFELAEFAVYDALHA